MKVNIKRVVHNDIDMSCEEILNLAISAIKEDADLKYKWINERGKLETEKYCGSHSFFDEIGYPSIRQSQADNLIDLIKLYMTPVDNYEN